MESLEVWEKREIAWEYEHKVRVLRFHAILSYSQISTSVSINSIDARKMFSISFIK